MLQAGRVLPVAASVPLLIIGLMVFNKGLSWNNLNNSAGRGTRLTRREEGAYTWYATDEQRRQTGWIGTQNGQVIS